MAFDYPEFESLPEEAHDSADYRKALQKLESFTDILNEVGEGSMKILDKKTNRTVLVSRKYALALTVWDLAIRYRDKEMIKLLYDRKDGKPSRTINVVGDKDKPIEIKYTAVDAPKVATSIPKIPIDMEDIEDAEIEFDGENETVPFPKNGTNNKEE